MFFVDINFRKCSHFLNTASAKTEIWCVVSCRDFEPAGFEKPGRFWSRIRRL